MTDIRDAQARFLQTVVPWTWWLHVTPRQPVAKENLRQGFLHYLHHVAYAAGTHLLCLFAFEGDSSSCHVHSQVALPQGHELDAELLASIWRRNWEKNAGLTHIVRFDPSEEGARYVVKMDDWHIEPACPNKGACRRKGCKKSINDIALELVRTRPAPHPQ